MIEDIRKYRYKVTLYLNKEEVDTIMLEAPDPIWAIQTILLMLNEKNKFPKWDAYSQPEFIND